MRQSIIATENDNLMYDDEIHLLHKLDRECYEAILEAIVVETNVKSHRATAQNYIVQLALHNKRGS